MSRQAKTKPNQTKQIELSNKVFEPLQNLRLRHRSSRSKRSMANPLQNTCEQTLQVMPAARRMSLSSDSDLIHRTKWEYLLRLRTLPCCNAVWNAGSCRTNELRDAISQNTDLAQATISGSICRMPWYLVSNSKPASSNLSEYAIADLPLQIEHDQQGNNRDEVPQTQVVKDECGLLQKHRWLPWCLLPYLPIPPSAKSRCFIQYDTQLCDCPSLPNIF